MGWGTRQSPRHLSSLLSRTYQTGCNGHDDCGRPRSNAVDWATQVSQQRKGRGGAGKKGRWPGYSMRPKSSKESWPEDWLSKQGVLTREHWLSNEQVKTRCDYRQANGCCVLYHFWANEKRTCYGSTQKNRRFLVKIRGIKLVYTGDTQWEKNLLWFHSKE